MQAVAIGLLLSLSVIQTVFGCVQHLNVSQRLGFNGLIIPVHDIEGVKRFTQSQYAKRLKISASEAEVKWSASGQIM